MSDPKEPQIRFRRRATAAVLATYGAIALWVQACSEKPGSPTGHAGATAERGALSYVGARACQKCHEQEYGDWESSHHHKAMQAATPETVLGDFSDVTFTHFGHETRFYRKGDAFWINAEDSEGVRQDYEVAYTFGVYPLQQYLIPFPGGRYQALAVCWDARPEAEGGQRWYHLYPDEEVPPADPLHWTRPFFNWNRMCAECHSTGLQKNYSTETDTYATRWEEINVSCEACHGPGSGHLAWAEEYGADRDPDKTPTGTLGLALRLKEPGAPAAWTISPDTGQPQRSRPLSSSVQLDTCAPCHSRRQALADAPFHGQPFHDTHVPSTLMAALYHPDGQIDEEVYVYGSFTQSKMFHKGVRCTDCHHHHTMRPLAPGNALCVRCHVATTYDVPSHHHHPEDSSGARCVSCHMPGKFYMGIDWRLDHSIRIPRPDLAEALQAPDGCTSCHGDKDTRWAAETSLAWWGDSLTKHPNFAGTLKGGEPTELAALARAPSFPSIVRASALERLQHTFDGVAVTAAEKALSDTDPLVRRTAVSVFENLPAEERFGPLSPLLDDPVRSVRTEVARLLAASSRGRQLPSFEKALAEYIGVLEIVADQPGGQMGAALLHTDLGRLDEAEKYYRRALVLDPAHVPSRVNLSELLHGLGRDVEALTLLKNSISKTPANSLLHEALGRAYVRQRDYDKGVEHIRTAAELDPGRAPIQYFYGVALNSLGRFPEALPYLQRAHELDPENLEYLTGLATVCRDAGEIVLAASYVDILLVLSPNNPNFQALRDQLP